MTKPLSERLEHVSIRAEQWQCLNLADLLMEAADLAKRVESAPVAIMDTRLVLGICAPAEEDFPALYAMQGRRVALVPVEVSA